MKKILLAAVIISIGFAACKKDNEAQPEKVKIEKKTMDGEEGGDDSKSGSEGNGGGWGG
ncbi:hypothetical protein [Desertivirga brevis]|uniref:hypothetical protein n=1 Tax=Desertivirga brevis TaxID=2810310 RepID=UPI001A96AEC4|nr:hypothetical protein [Pedobacter sp. SYSU D00873]